MYLWKAKLFYYCCENKTETVYNKNGHCVKFLEKISRIGIQNI